MVAVAVVVAVVVAVGVAVGVGVVVAVGVAVAVVVGVAVGVGVVVGVAVGVGVAVVVAVGVVVGVVVAVGVVVVTSLRVSVYGVPQPAGSKIAGQAKNGRLFVRDASTGSTPWKRQVAQAAGEAMEGHELLEGPLLLMAKFYLPRPAGHFGKRGLRPSAPEYPTKRPDTTKLLRAVEDAMTGIVWRDDAQVVIQQAVKLFGEPSRCELHVQPATSTAATT